MKLRILHWNILYKHCLHRLDEIIEEIRRFDADVVCLQEVANYNGDEKHLDPLFKLYPYYMEHITEEFEKDTIRNCILSKYPINNEYFEYVQESLNVRGDAEQEARVYVECDIKIGDQRLNIGTVHSSYVKEFRETELKTKEMSNLMNIIKNKKENYIITGDLNTIPTSTYINEISKYLNNISPSFEKNTFTTKPFEINDFKTDKLKYRLDYIFATKDIKLLDTDILTTELSDHLPIMSIIEI